MKAAKMMPLKSRKICCIALALVFALSLGLIAAASNEEVVGGEKNDDNAEPNIAERGSSTSNRSAAASSAATTLADPALDADSVVLVTGAAGFLGSELALALRRTYNVKKLLLVDNLGIVSENESSYVPPPADGGKWKAIYEKLSENELSTFEIKRQRAFRLYHELTAASLDEEGGEGIRNDAESIRFYRADMRPSIPEFFDFGEVPLLEGIFQSHPDITHVVHLADVPVLEQTQAIPRRKDSVKTGPMEGLLEELRLMLERAASSDGNEEVRLPQFVYASSYEVYDALSTADKQSTSQMPNPPPFQEDKPITTPSSLHGTAKLIDEVLASAYHSTHGIYSVGLRFFSVYGPWNAPGTEVFDLAEQVAALNDGQIPSDDIAFDEDVKDYVYIDDAVDAIMSAMQYRPPGADPPPVVFNVGTGKGSTLKEVREDMLRHFPKLSQTAQRSARSKMHAQRKPTQSYASTSRSKSLLGFQAQVPLSEGLAHTLLWHRDRASPYGHGPNAEESLERQNADAAITESLAESANGAGGEESWGGENCSPLDRECLRGAPVFPCASECGRSGRCTPSAWDDVAALSEMVTSGCDAVLYTILLDEGAEQISSATTAAASDSLPYVGAGLPADVRHRTQARCNIAFVSDRSPLVRRLQSEGEEYLDEENTNDGGSLPPLLRHGFWTVLPVSTPSLDANSSSWIHAFDGTYALEYLPKVSPGRFFGSSVRYAIYTAPSTLLDNLPDLLRRIEDGPPGLSSDSARTTIMLSAKRPACDPAKRGSTCASTWVRPEKNDVLQWSVYNMARVALRGDMLGGGLDSVIDSSFMAHSLRGEDSRLFRCDVYGEVAQWGASSDERAVEFIVSLHDLWSRAVSHWSEQKIWWNGGDSNTAAVVEGEGGDGEEKTLENKRQRLAESSDAKDHLEGKWMGVLSSMDRSLFAHIVPSKNIGIIHLDDHQR